MFSNALKEVFDFSKINWRLWLLLFLSFFIPFAYGLILFGPLPKAAIFYGVVPIAFVLLVLREPIKSFGICFGSKARVVSYTVVFSLLLTPVIAIASFFPSIGAYYSMPSTITGFSSFLSFEASTGLSLFFWELFFRGFILFGLFKRIGKTALPVHAIPFALFHIGKPNVEVVASFFAALLLGQIALKAKSFLPAFLIHWVIHAEMVFLANLA